MTLSQIRPQDGLEDLTDLSALWEPDEPHDLLGEPDEPDLLADLEPVPDLPKPPVTYPGDLWLLGPHRSPTA